MKTILDRTGRPGSGGNSRGRQIERSCYFMARRERSAAHDAVGPPWGSAGPLSADRSRKGALASAWCPGRASNPYALSREAADFKSAVSTDFTTRAHHVRLEPALARSGARGIENGSGGATRSRTGLYGFAIRCITALLSRHWSSKAIASGGRVDTKPKILDRKKGSTGLPFLKRAAVSTGGADLHCLEREKSLELSTSTLARLRSTN